jgi:hypothetical protein
VHWASKVPNLRLRYSEYQTFAPLGSVNAAADAVGLRADTFDVL